MVLCTFVFLVVCIGILLKLYIKLSTAWDTSATCLVGKTAIITGANTGIGLYTALDFAKRGARVILACRNKEKAEEAKDKIIKETGNPNVVIKLVDMSSLSSVREFANDIIRTEERLDILVNNAGAMYLGNKTTQDGLPLLMQTNHYSPFLLTNMLLGKLKESAPSRIVVVSSIGAMFTKLNPNTINSYPKGSFPEMIDYLKTKLANMYFTIEMAKKLRGTEVTINCLHPGCIGSDMHRTMTDISHYLVFSILSLFLKTSEEGAQTSIYVSVSKDIAGVSGQHFDRCKRIPMYKSARDENVAEEVWKISEKAVKLADSEKHF